MPKEYFLKLLVLPGSLGPVSVHAQPGIAEGPYIVNFQAIPDATTGLSASEAESGLLTVHEPNVPSGHSFHQEPARRQGNDWNFGPFNNFTSWNRVTGYINGVLVWGETP